MRITSLSAFFIIILGGLDMLASAFFARSISAFVFGEGSFMQRLFFCLVGVSSVFFVVFVKIYKPFKSLCK